jgi:hypothetical protein
VANLSSGQRVSEGSGISSNRAGLPPSLEASAAIRGDA